MIKSRSGYVLVRVAKDHPQYTPSQTYVLEHRALMAAHLGRRLLRTEIVHHENEVRDDNRLENLKLKEWGEHTRDHCLGRPLSEETKRKLSLARKGSHHSEETKRKISEGGIGLKRSEEARRNMSIAQKGRTKSPEHRKKLAAALRGRKLSLETRSKMSQAHQRRLNKSSLSEDV